ncbi:hypothetical protein IFM89_037767 [Coptis chinensis]|uniref:Uncharacterized protein n=1 Tax=Coptis chinensis TaxID=261450 RepID=A0A835MGS8_9MAGN|nr:hypothetical protein IFM89_037767 [Coptis chinensis]
MITCLLCRTHKGRLDVELKLVGEYGLSTKTRRSTPAGDESSLTAPLIPQECIAATNEDLELSMAIATYIHSSSMDERPLHPNAHKSILDSKPVYWINSSENSSTPNNRGLTRGPASPLGSSSSRWSYKPAQVGYNGWDVPKVGLVVTMKLREHTFNMCDMFGCSNRGGLHPLWSFV